MRDKICKTCNWFQADSPEVNANRGSNVRRGQCCCHPPNAEYGAPQVYEVSFCSEYTPISDMSETPRKSDPAGHPIARVYEMALVSQSQVAEHQLANDCQSLYRFYIDWKLTERQHISREQFAERYGITWSLSFSLCLRTWFKQAGIEVKS